MSSIFLDLFIIMYEVLIKKLFYRIQVVSGKLYWHASSENKDTG